MDEQKELEKELATIEAEFGVEILNLKKEQSEATASFLERLKQEKIDSLRSQLGASHK